MAGLLAARCQQQPQHKPIVVNRTACAFILEKTTAPNLMKVAAPFEGSMDGIILAHCPWMDSQSLLHHLMDPTKAAAPDLLIAAVDLSSPGSW